MAKLLGSVLIFSMHCNALGDYKYGSIALQMLARWGVPFFFICSSFFLFSNEKGGNITDEQLRKYLHRLFALYSIWLVYNLPNVFFLRLYLKDLKNPIVWLVFLKNSILSSTFTASWYLGSSIFSAWLVYVLCKRMKTQKVLLISAVLYLPCIFSSVYGGLLAQSIQDALSFACFPLNIVNGCVCFSLGKLICENQPYISAKLSCCKCAFLFALFYIIYSFEILFADRFSILKSTDVGFCVVPAAVFLFLMLLQLPIRVRDSVTLRKISTIVYLGQGNVLIAKSVCGKYLGVNTLLGQYLIALSMISAIAILVMHVQRKSEWRWVKYMT